MICEKCKKNSATVHLVRVVNGVKSEQHLCAECAEQGGEINLNKGDIADFFPFFGKMQQIKKVGFAPCPVCGQSLTDLQNSGLVGCDKCYEHFNSYLMQVLPRIQRDSVHKGKAPLRDFGALAKTKELEDLKIAMAKCIMEENFEQAAILRDKMRNLEGGEKND